MTGREQIQARINANLRSVMDALADSVAESSDEDILFETLKSGKDPARLAARTRGVLVVRLEKKNRRRSRNS